ncbi:DUF4402 domain-containing protein [Gillisia marina]|uniref:DUF4402 domain-containing protein n=1 Tax=Gillisia marina TaxID=1167637 RepID=UPI00029A397D|nr:DUF4402 domain-containing protein [Gillisia marina]
MNKFIILIFSLFTVIGYAQSSASTSINTSAKIVNPIKITKSVDLNFGNVIGGFNAGTLVLSPDGTRTANGVQISNATPGEVNAAEALVTHGNNNYAITLPNTFSLFNEDNPSQSLKIDQFTVSPTSNGDNEGTDVLKIGATLNLEANQVPGSYSNPSGFNVTVSYN